MPKLQKITENDRLADTISANLIAPVKKKQQLLEETELGKRFEQLLVAMRLKWIHWKPKVVSVIA